MDKKEDFRHIAIKKGIRRVKAKGKKEVNALWGLSLFGLVGWTVVLPALVGVLLGLWLDKPGKFLWTVSLLVLGIFIGCLLALYFLKNELSDKEEKIVSLALSFAVGCLVGALFFLGLWWTISQKRSPLWYFLSFLIRALAAAFIFYWVAGEDITKYAFELLGFLLSRRLILRRKTHANNT